MRTIPEELKADGLKIYAKISNLNMPLSEAMIKKLCGHLPRSEMEAKIMARRLKGRWLEFPNINLGQQRRKMKTLTGWRDHPDKRQARIERRERRERGVTKVTIKFILEDGYEKKMIIHKIGMKLLTLDGLKTNPIKDSSTTQAILEFDNKIKQPEFYEKIYPMIIELLDEEVKEFTGVNFAD